MSDTTEDRPSPRRWLRWLLVLLPAWLLASGAVALWWYFDRERGRALERDEAFARQVSVAGVADDLRKLGTIVGERNTASPTARANLARAASMVEGALGPSNTGYAVRRLAGPDEWSLLQVTLPGSDPKAAPLWVVTGYDSPRGEPGAGSGLAATMAVAQALADLRPRRAVHFLFLPHARESEGPVAATLDRVATMAPAPATLLWIDVMGDGGELRVSLPPGVPLVRETLAGLGRFVEDNPADSSDALWRLAADSSVPLVRVAGDRGAGLPPGAGSDSADATAAAAGRLAEWIRRQAALP